MTFREIWRTPARRYLGRFLHEINVPLIWTTEEAPVESERLLWRGSLTIVAIAIVLRNLPISPRHPADRFHRQIYVGVSQSQHGNRSQFLRFKGVVAIGELEFEGLRPHFGGFGMSFRKSCDDVSPRN